MVEGADEFQRFQSSGERKNVKLAVPVRQGCELPLIWIFRGDLLVRVVYFRFGRISRRQDQHHDDWR
jgi:hypothetical protein